MKKKILKYSLLAIFILLVLCTISNVYKWIVSGKQEIKISTSKQAFTNSDLYVSTVVEKDGVDIDTKAKLKLVDGKGKKVKGTKVSYNGNSAIIKIPDIESGNYYIEAKVSSKEGKDTVKQAIYIAKDGQENITITLDKGIYKPGDTVNFRALITSKENDIPLKEDVNICIYDGNDNKVYNEFVTASEYGIVSGSFKLADEVNSGLYRLVVKTENKETTKGFKVNPYVTPKYEVKITSDKDYYLTSETAKLDIEAKYFFGEPASNTMFSVYINDEKYKEIRANENGLASIEYKIDEAKTYNIKVEAVDTSNYYVEATSSFSAGTDLFEVELLPEYGDLVAGEKNTIFVVTKKTDGTPVKAYLTITSNNTTKQVATDENGIGKFTMDVNSRAINNANNAYESLKKDTSTYKNTYVQEGAESFNITAESVDGETIVKRIILNKTDKDLLLSTDEVKYNQGEDINIKILSSRENNKNIYFFKNNKLLKIITTDMPETSVNLDEVYGLIDIFITEENNSYSYYNRFTSYKKTIFIKPEKALNIKIGTDKEEYKPGENIIISLGTTDENNNNVESALLVSMLDNSILNLANNDLSIDNIKLALQDIEFTDELDAATLYASIMDDKSENTLTTLLLRQENTDSNISENILYNYEEREKAQGISILLICLIIVIVFNYALVKLKKLRDMLKHIINVLIFEILLNVLICIIIEEFFWKSIDYSFWTLLITSILGLAAYILWISKLFDKTFRTSISIIITLIALIIFMILYDLFDIVGPVILTIGAILILVFAILSKTEKLKNKKIIRFIAKEALYIIKFIAAGLFAEMIGAIFEGFISGSGISKPIAVIALYFINYWINKIGKEKTDETKEEYKTAKEWIVIVLAIIGIISVGYFAIRIFGSAAGSVGPASISIEDGIDYSRGSSGSTVIRPSDIVPNYSSVESSKSSSSGISSIFEDASDFLNIGKGITNSADSAAAIDTRATESMEVSTETKSETSVDDNIRNVFLESMCFIPEVIAEKGNAKVDLKLSDNITTWTIQTVGNTKDGKVGFGILDTVKVFKEFFVDFELPANLVKGDKISIPVTVYNYTEDNINTTLKIKEEEWFTLERNNINVSISASSSKMVYVPIEVIKNGNYKLRIEVSSSELTDIIEKSVNITPNGYKIEKVVSSGILDEDIEEDVLVLEKTIENTEKAKVKIYASNMAQNVEGMENIFRMPTGCFEQISSSLYPNILALRYLEENNIVNDEIKQKALQYISSGYQKLLTYEVQGESGGFSLYGDSPAETVLTAYGLMELTDLKEVYKVDEAVLKRMTDFLYKKQNMNGSFTITGYHQGGAGSRETLAQNAYIIWALSESDPKNSNLTKSVEYLKDKLDNINDNYTLALVANVLANVNDKEAKTVIKRLVNNVNVSGKEAYITSNVVDYYGCRYDYQTMQTVSLTSMALSKTSSNEKINKQLINYLISKKDTYGTWYSTQATILALKAINEFSEKSKLSNQTIKVSINSEVQEIEIKDNQLEIYQLTFDNLDKENKLKIDIEKGNAYYEIIEEYYIPYESVKTEENNIEVKTTADSSVKVNDILNTNITLTNKNEDTIYNGMVTISIPAGCEVLEESLMLLETKGIIEKYEMNYRTVNIYLRDFEVSQLIKLEVNFRARYPVDVTGLSVRAYDYYNPNVEGYSMPISIKVTD